MVAGEEAVGSFSQLNKFEALLISFQDWCKKKGKMLWLSPPSCPAPRLQIQSRKPRPTRDELYPRWSYPNMRTCAYLASVRAQRAWTLGLIATLVRWARTWRKDESRTLLKNLLGSISYHQVCASGSIGHRLQQHEVVDQ